MRYRYALGALVALPPVSAVGGYLCTALASDGMAAYAIFLTGIGVATLLSLAGILYAAGLLVWSGEYRRDWSVWASLLVYHTYALATMAAAGH